MPRTRILLGGVSLLTAAVICGCATSPPPLPSAASKTRRLTPGMVTSTIKDKVTTQTEVLSAFGAPNIITRDKSGREVWTYDVQSVSHSSATTSRSGGVGITGGGLVRGSLIGGGAGGSGGKSTSTGETSSSTFTLMITFANDGVVQTYQMMSTQF